MAVKIVTTLELQWLKNLRDHENMFETAGGGGGGFELMSVNHSARSGGKIAIYMFDFL